MTDPERLLDTDGGGLSAALLRAGRAEGPSDKLLADTLVAADGPLTSTLLTLASGASLKKI